MLGLRGVGIGCWDWVFGCLGFWVFGCLGFWVLGFSAFWVFGLEFLGELSAGCVRVFWVRVFWVLG